MQLVDSFTGASQDDKARLPGVNDALEDNQQRKGSNPYKKCGASVRREIPREELIAAWNLGASSEHTLYDAAGLSKWSRVLSLIHI